MHMQVDRKKSSFISILSSASMVMVTVIHERMFNKFFKTDLNHYCKKKNLIVGNVKVTPTIMGAQT